MGWWFWDYWLRTILMKNIRQKQSSQFPCVHYIGKPWWGVAYVPRVTNLRALYAWVIGGKLPACCHWLDTGRVDGHCPIMFVLTHIHVTRDMSAAPCKSLQWAIYRSTSVLPTNHVIQMPHCLSGVVNHDYKMEFHGTSRANEMGN